MQTQTAAASAATDYSFEFTKRERTGSRYVFFAGNVMDSSLRSINPAWSAGGILLPEVHTLKHCQGFVRQARITPLRPYMFAEFEGFVAPDKRDQKHRTVTLVIRGEKREIGLIPSPDNPGQLVWDGNLRTPFYPADELPRLLAHNQGLVEMPVANDIEATEAQFFLLPSWQRIEQGEIQLPTKLSDLKKFFNERLKVAENNLQANAASAAIRSCELLEAYGDRLIREENAEYIECKGKNQPFAFSPRAEMMFETLNRQRPDILQQQQGDKLDKIVDVLARQAALEQARAERAAAGASAPATLSELLTPAERAELDAFRKWQQEMREPAKSTDNLDDDEFAVGDKVMFGGREAVIKNKLGGTPGRRYKIAFVDDEATEIVYPQAITKAE